MKITKTSIFSILKSNKSSKLQKKHFCRAKYEKEFFNKYIKSFKKPINTIYVERGAIKKDYQSLKNFKNKS